MNSIYFDMDGTIADLYSQSNWLMEIEQEERTDVFKNAEPMFDMNWLNAAVEKLKSLGNLIGVITWTPKDASALYCERVKNAKLDWLKRYIPAISEDNIYVLPYGKDKKLAPIKRTKRMFLIDDNKEVRERWRTNVQRIALSEKELKKFIDEMVNNYND